MSRSAARDAGAISKEEFKALLPSANAAQKAAQEQSEMLANDSVASKLLALGHGATKGAAFMAGAPPGAEIGAGIGALIPGLEPVTVPFGAALGGAVTGGIASWGAGKILDKLAEHSKAFEAFQQAAAAHPVYDAAGNLISFSAGAPKAALSAIGRGIESITPEGEGLLAKGLQTAARGYAKGTGAGGIAESVGNLAADSANRAAQGAGLGARATALASQVGKYAGANLAIDTAIKETAKAMGLSDQGQTLPGAVQAAILGGIMAGNGITFKDGTNGEVADIMVRGKVREYAGLARNDTFSAQDIAANFPNADGMTVAALSKPLTAHETEIYNAAKAKIQEALNRGDDLSNGAAVTARQAMIGGQPYGNTSAQVTPLESPASASPGQPTGGTPSLHQRLPPSSQRSSSPPSAPAPGEQSPHQPSSEIAPGALAESQGQSNRASSYPVGIPTPASGQQDNKDADPAAELADLRQRVQRVPTSKTDAALLQAEHGRIEELQAMQQQQRASSQQQPAFPEVTGVPEIQKAVMDGTVSHADATAQLQHLGLNPDDITRAIGPAPTAANSASPATRPITPESEILPGAEQPQPPAAANHQDESSSPQPAADQSQPQESELEARQRELAELPQDAPPWRRDLLRARVRQLQAETQASPSPTAEPTAPPHAPASLIPGLVPEDNDWGVMQPTDKGRQIVTRTGLAGTVRSVGKQSVAFVDEEGKMHVAKVATARLLASTRPGLIPGLEHDGTLTPQAPPASPVDSAAHDAATSPANTLAEPTEAQREAGNFQKGHVRIGGLDISIEHPAGSQRQPDWQPLTAHYGYIRGSVSGDGQQIDTFIKPGTPTNYAGPVFVINRHPATPGGAIDHKAIIGAASAQEALQIHNANYPAALHASPGDVATFNSIDSFRHWATGASRRTAPAKGDVTNGAPRPVSEPPKLTEAQARRARALNLIATKRALRPAEQAELAGLTPPPTAPHELETTTERNQAPGNQPAGLAQALGTGEEPGATAGTGEPGREAAAELERKVRAVFNEHRGLNVVPAPDSRSAFQFNSNTGEIGYNLSKIHAKRDAINAAESGLGDKWMRFGALEEVAHWLDAKAAQLAGSEARAIQVRAWGSAPRTVKEAFPTVYRTEVSHRGAGRN